MTRAAPYHLCHRAKLKSLLSVGGILSTLAIRSATCFTSFQMQPCEGLMGNRSRIYFKVDAASPFMRLFWSIRLCYDLRLAAIVIKLFSQFFHVKPCNYAGTCGCLAASAKRHVLCSACAFNRHIFRDIIPLTSRFIAKSAAARALVSHLVQALSLLFLRILQNKIGCS